MTLNPQTQNTGLYQVFTRGDLHLVIPDSECSFETLQNIEQAGFILRWDSAPSLFKGAQYAAEHYQAFVPVDRADFKEHYTRENAAESARLGSIAHPNENWYVFPVKSTDRFYAGYHQPLDCDWAVQCFFNGREVPITTVHAIEHRMERDGF